MTLKNKFLLIFANIVVVMTILFLNLAYTDLSNPVRLGIFICLLLTLAVPSIMLFIFNKYDSPEVIITMIAIIANLTALSIMFLINIEDSKPFIITESIIGGVYLTLLLISLGLKANQQD